MTAFLKSFDEYWQTNAGTRQKLVPPKLKFLKMNHFFLN